VAIDCGIADDLCNLKWDYAEYVYEATRDARLEKGFFLLGKFNGRTYRFAEIDGVTMIVIQDEKVRALGKFELPGSIPSDFLVSTDLGD
jgi:hypothetical protein